MKASRIKNQLGASLIAVVVGVGILSVASVAILQSITAAQKSASSIKASAEASSLFQWARFAVADPGRCANVVRWVSGPAGGQTFLNPVGQEFGVSLQNANLPARVQVIGDSVNPSAYSQIFNVQVNLKDIQPLAFPMYSRVGANTYAFQYFRGNLEIVANLINKSFFAGSRFRDSTPIVFLPNSTDGSGHSLSFCSLKKEHVAWIGAGNSLAAGGKSALECMTTGGRLSFESGPSGDSVAKCYFPVPTTATTDWYKYCPQRMQGIAQPAPAIRFSYAAASGNANLLPNIAPGFGVVTNNGADPSVWNSVGAPIVVSGLVREIECQ